MSYSRHLRHTPQSQPLPDKQMIVNAAGGYVFAIDDWKRLKRFLILGCEGGTYYEGERKLTLENVSTVRRCLAADGPRTVKEIIAVSEGGLAPKNDAAVFALAAATKFGDDATRRLAFDALPRVCRIGTHLFQFTESREAMGGGWGRGMRRAIAKIYDRPDVVTQVLKYQQRNGWSHRDLLRLSHPKNDTRAPIFDAVCRPQNWSKIEHPLAQGWTQIRSAENAKQAAQLINQYGLPRELVPTEFLKDSVTWEALLSHMPLHALVRNLGNLSKVGLLTPLSDAAHMISARLSDQAAIQRSRLHPFSILIAARTYAAGRGFRGAGEWTPVPQVIDALDRAFSMSFPNVQPTNARYLLAVDVSGSMSCQMSGMPMSCAEAAAAIALTIARTETSYHIMGFSSQFVDLGIRASDSLTDVLQKTRHHNFGGTDTSIAIEYAMRHRWPVDVFVVLTDNETWCGDMHACIALEKYRQTMRIDSKLAVVAFTATGRSIGDAADMNTMDFVGMDASLPQALSAFVTL